MKRYKVNRREVWVQSVIVEANSEEEALSKAYFGNVEVVDDELEFSHFLNSETYTIEECNRS